MAENYKELYGNLSERYLSLKQERDKLAGLWRDCSKLTIPYILPEENKEESLELKTPYNSIGTVAVNNLASKLLTALLPNSGVFFRLLPSAEKFADATEEQLKEIDTVLSDLEQEIMDDIAAKALRVPLFEAMKTLIVTGNVLLYKVPNSTFKVFNPYQYVVRRDYVGNLLEIIIEEKVSKLTLPKEVQSKINSEQSEKDQEDKDLTLYTGVLLQEDGNWVSYQEINDVYLDSTNITYKTEELPYLPLRWTNVYNEDYGRGLVEQYIGDLRTLEGLSKTIVTGTSAMAKVVFGLRPASSTRIEDLAKADSGDVVKGDLERDITTLKVDKNMDFQIPFNLLQSLEQRISKAFLLLGNSIRDSERTTAFEVRAVANELESTLGGTYSVLAQDLQLPLLRLILKEMSPEALKSTVPSIVTGSSAISRERDFQNLNILLQSLAQLGGDVLQKYLKVDGYISEIAKSLGIDDSLIVKSPEEIQQENQQQAMMQQGGAGGMPMPPKQ